MADLLSAIRNLAHLYEAVLTVAIVIGLAVVPLVLLGCEWSKRRAL